MDPTDRPVAGAAAVAEPLPLVDAAPDAVRYGWAGDAPEHTHGYLVPVILRWLRRLGARRVLDLGCGNGAMAAGLCAAGFDVVGVEPDPVGAAIAAQRHRRLRVLVGGVDEDPTRLLHGEAPFDAVLSAEVVEHLYAPSRLPRFAALVTRPGGHLLVTTPYHGYWKNLALSLAGRWDHHHTALWEGGHIKFFSRPVLERLLREGGFEPVGFEGMGRFPGLWKSMLVVAQADPGRK